jgi:hypothetical protein
MMLFMIVPGNPNGFNHCYLKNPDGSIWEMGSFKGKIATSSSMDSSWATAATTRNAINLGVASE